MISTKHGRGAGRAFRQGAPGAGGVLIAPVGPLILEADYENLAGLLHG
jgi:hypothetical protein